MLVAWVAMWTRRVARGALFPCSDLVRGSIRPCGGRQGEHDYGRGLSRQI